MWHSVVLSHIHLLIIFVNVSWLHSQQSNCQVWPSMATHTLNLCSAFNPSKCTHTAVSSEQTHTHTHTLWTHTWFSGQPFMLRRPGSSWEFGALLKGLTSVVVLTVESTGHSLPPLTIPAGPETRTRDLCVSRPTFYPLGHDCLLIEKCTVP